MSYSELIVLGFLKIRPMHGYEIITLTKTKGLDVWAGIKMPSVYNALQRLDKNELIKGEKKTEKNNPPKKVYTITSDGEIHLRKLILKYFNKKNLLPQTFWLVLSFMAHNITKKDLINIIRKRIIAIREHLPCHDQTCKKLSENINYTDVPFHLKSLIKMGTELHKIELANLEEIEREILTGNQDHLFIDEEE